MWATERLLEIEQRFGSEIERIMPLELDGQTIWLILYLHDGTNFRLTEQWSGDVLDRYSYYWLTATNELKIDWDNAPHHTRLTTFPHHKHIGRQRNIQPSEERDSLLGKYAFGQLLGKRGVLRPYGQEELEDDLTYARGE